MLKPNVLKLLNEQVNHELYSSYLYLSMAAYFESKNLPGFASWMHAQSAEEREHGMKFYEYVFDRGDKVTLTAIKAPQTDWASPTAVFEQVVNHEEQVTSLINAIYAEAAKENDFATQVMLHWFIDEQVEEEKNAGQVLDSLKKIEEKGTAIFYLDHQLGKRSGE